MRANLVDATLAARHPMMPWPSASLELYQPWQEHSCMAPVETWGNSQVTWPQFFQEPSRRKLREWGGQPRAYSTINQCLGFLAVKRVLFSATVIKHPQTSRERTCVCFETSSCTCTSVEAAWF